MRKRLLNLIISIFSIILIIFISFQVFGEKEKPKEENAIIKEIPLPEPKMKGEVSIEEVLSKRRSIRSYTNENLKLEEISQILWAAYGITEKKDKPDRLRGGFRTAPSAGATYPLDIYLIAGEIESLAPGIYKYDSSSHSLLLMEEGDKRTQLFLTCLQPWVKSAPASIIYTAKWDRITSKYGDRGTERYVYLEVGHSAQNVYLQATALGLGTVAVGAFNDKKLKDFLSLEEGEDPLYIMPLGKKKDE
ncbi:MAG: SagB/ThcOx family dehydrogenase [bacterium]|nr:SagB/ThcOx family dehydrogenase [bacterium]